MLCFSVLIAISGDCSRSRNVRPVVSQFTYGNEGRVMVGQSVFIDELRPKWNQAGGCETKRQASTSSSEMSSYIFSSGESKQ